MSIDSLLSSADTALLVKLLSYTVFYAAMAWIPLRVLSAVARRRRELCERRREQAIRTRLASGRSTALTVR